MQNLQNKIDSFTNYLWCRKFPPEEEDLKQISLQVEHAIRTKGNFNHQCLMQQQVENHTDAKFHDPNPYIGVYLPETVAADC